jgi:predicted nuclease of restriction endonuclease-like (RecB) superfamily
MQQPVAKLPWGHLTVLLDRVDNQETRDWYAVEAVRYGWSRAVLLNQVKSQLHLRAGAAPTNFKATLEPRDSELVQSASTRRHQSKHQAGEVFKVMARLAQPTTTE